MLDALRYFSALARGGLAPFVRQAVGQTTLADVVARSARKRPNALALEVGDEAFSCAQLAQLANAAAGQLSTWGAKTGDVVALVGKNSVAYVGLLLGAAQRGVTLALVHPELGAEPLRHALRAAKATRVLCERQLLKAVAAASDLPAYAFDPEQREPFLPDAAASREFAPARGAHDMALVYTSGTTGLPKACRLPHARVLAAACLFGAPLYDFRPADKLLCALPLHHGSPLMLGLSACLVTGTPLRLERRFSASALIDAARRSRATVLLYVGDLGRMLLATPEAERDRDHALRLAVGNGLSAEVWTRLQERFGIGQVREFYAATESPMGLFNLSGRVGSVGNLPYAWMFGMKLVRIDPETGELLRDRAGKLAECGVDEPGELLVRARQRGLGVYHGYVDSQATESRLVRSGSRNKGLLFRTGDVLRRDRDGFYYFVERRGDSYRFRGENVAVAQVEHELERLDGVRSAVVTGVQVPGYDGRVGLAALEWEPGFQVSSLTTLSGRLPRSALPRFVRRLEELPRTSSLKVRRRALAAEGVDPERAPAQLWVLQGDTYIPLDSAAYRDILAGNLRL
ncbi:MAG TPA: AMP-binding protein [Polyangiaceae bacterium]|nr:AMP-binding protein [Polyangiaceae bacterium]